MNGLTVSAVLAAYAERRAIIARRSSTVVVGLLISSSRQPCAAFLAPGRQSRSGGAMTFYDPALYARDEEEDFGDSGAYSESLEEDFEEEEEEEEEAAGPEPETSEPVMSSPP